MYIITYTGRFNYIFIWSYCSDHCAVYPK